MELLFAIMVGTLYGCALYLLLRRSIVKLAIGLILLGNGANLLLFSSGGLVRGRPPLVPPDGTVVVPPAADPLPQALILTAIVISFGVLVFAVALIYRTHRALRTDDLDDLVATDRLGEVSEAAHRPIEPVAAGVDPRSDGR
ncbi:MAG: Na+/H+ antiporter subunit C [Thermomicrobium sp.]|nr:Na+/H+ antiporter subunit C [Thermomicrobium sp.]MDW8059059.1 Na+/H+ antiporter subunit C [Thermomicrobium sp.]